MNNTVLLQPNNCVNVNESLIQFCLPIRRVCYPEPDSGLVTRCDNIWNCNLPCNELDRRYYIPYLVGDKIQIQTLVRTGTKERVTPFSSIHTLKLIKIGSDVEHDFTPSRSMSAWKDGQSFQIFEIDTTNLEGCWYIKINDDYCTQWFGQLVDCNSTSYVLKSECNSNCFGYQYGEPDNYSGDLIEYDDSIRVLGSIKNIGTSVEKEVDEINNRVDSQTFKDNFELSMRAKVPPFIKNVLTKQILYCGSFYVDNEIFYNDGLNISNKNRFGSMWKFSFEMYQMCDEKGACSATSGHCVI